MSRNATSILRRPLGYAQITALSVAVPLTVPAGARRVVIQPETQTVRWRDDGTAPTATVGMPLTTSEVLTYDGDLSAIQFIEATASAKLNVAFYG